MISTTFLVALVLAAAPSAEEQAAIRFLQTMQTPSGGFVTIWPADRGTARPSLRTTRTALRTFRMLGALRPTARRSVRYLHGCHDRDSGGFSDIPGAEPDAISTSVALMIMRELKMPIEPYVEAGLAFMNAHTQGFEQIRMVASGLEELDRTVPNAANWQREIYAARNADGSYGSGPGRARSTALYVVAQQRLGGKPESEVAVLEMLREGQRSDGGFGNDTAGQSDLESCYRVVRLFARLDALPDNPEKLREFIATCHNDDGGFGRTPEEPSSLHGTYYATILRYWLDGGR